MKMERVVRIGLIFILFVLVPLLSAHAQEQSIKNGTEESPAKVAGEENTPGPSDTNAPQISTQAPWSRSNKAEIFMVVHQWSESDSTGGGVTMDFDKSTMFGLGGGINMNDHVNLNGNMYFGSLDVMGHLDSSYYNNVGVSSDSTVIGLDMNIDLYLLKGRVTPLVTGGIGYVSFSGDVEGWSFSETDFSYNLGAGVRCDVSDHFFIKALYKSTWVTLEDADDSSKFDGLSVAVGYVF